MKSKFYPDQEKPLKDRFDLEDEITSLSIYSDQLMRLVNHLKQEGLAGNNQSLITKALEGIAVNINMHTSDLEDTMCQVLKLYPYNEGISAYEE